ncbi:MAG: GPP34 family phosphoprotein [Candidatus Odinarchaeota archaeon]
MSVLSSLLVSDMYILFNAKNSVKISEYGLVGAALMDLVIKRKVEIIGTRINLINTTSTGDFYLDGALSIISEFKTNKKVSFYFKKLLKRGKELFPLFSEHLESSKFMNLSIIKKRFFYDFTVSNFNNEIREEIINKLKEVLLQNSNISDKTFMYFLSILQATSLYKNILGKEYKKQVKSRMKELIIKEPIGKLVHTAVFAPDADII